MTDDDVTWLAEYEEDGEVYFRIGTTGPEVLAEWLGLARLRASRDGSCSHLTFEADADPRDIEKIRRGSAWLLQRQLEGRLGMHGAAVSVDGKAVVFLGRSGAGKSTFAAAMCARGAALLADDAVAIDPGHEPGTWVVAPREIDHWLDPPSRGALGGRTAGQAKEPVRTLRPATGAARLATFVELSFDADESDLAPRLELQSGIHAVAAMVPQMARFVLDEPARQRSELDLIHAMLATTRVFRLSRPRRFDRLRTSVDRVLELLGSDRWRV
ncbi:MAG TPA: hypothetical protein VM925_19170 [Labilithrix sp.]|nr:hypothetical protein [Labilithrix sp.]